MLEDRQLAEQGTDTEQPLVEIRLGVDTAALGNRWRVSLPAPIRTSIIRLRGEGMFPSDIARKLDGQVVDGEKVRITRVAVIAVLRDAGLLGGHDPVPGVEASGFPPEGHEPTAAPARPAGVGRSDTPRAATSVEHPPDAMSIRWAFVLVTPLPVWLLVTVLFAFQGPFDVLAQLLPELSGPRCREPLSLRRLPDCGAGLYRSMLMGVAAAVAVSGVLALLLGLPSRSEVATRTGRVVGQLGLLGATLFNTGWLLDLTADGIDSMRTGGYGQLGTKLMIAAGICVVPAFVAFIGRGIRAERKAK